MEKIEVIKIIDQLTMDYHKLMHESMEKDDDFKVFQFNGSCIALDILRQRIEELE